MTDILDKLKQSNDKQKDIIDKLYDSKGVSFSSSEPSAIKKALTVQHLRDSGSSAGAFLADIGATINKTLPNLKRLVNPDDKKAIEQIKKIEEFQDILRTAYPTSVFGGEVALPSATAIPTMGIGAGPALLTGVTEAAAFSGSEQDPRTNAAIAAVLPFIPDAVKKLGSGIGEVSEQFFRRTGDVLEASPEKQAGRVLKRFTEESELSPEQILRERAELGEGSTLADVQSMQGLAQGAALTPSGRTYTPKFEQRQLMQQERIKSKISEITGKKSESFTGDLNKFIEERALASEPLYKKAFDQEFLPTEQFKSLFSRLKNSGALKKASDILKIEGRKIEPESMSYTDLHALKMGIDDLIESESKKGGRNKVGALTRLKRDLLEEIESGNPDYKMARLQFSGDSGVINAAQLGADIFNPKKMGLKLSNEELKKEVANMSADEFTAFQGGMAKAVSDKLSDIPETADAARRLWSRPKVREVLGLAFENQDQFDRFLSTLDKETTFTNTLRNLYQGSQTAQREAGKMALKTGEIAALSPFRKILKGEISPEGIQSLTRLMFDPKVTNEEIKRVMIEAGIINDTATTKAIAAMRNKWEEVWSRINLPSISSSQKAAISSKLAQMNEEE